MTPPPKDEQWLIRRWQDPNLAEILLLLHAESFSGRLMLHIAGGNVVSMEACERAPLQSMSHAIQEVLDQIARDSSP